MLSMRNLLLLLLYRENIFVLQFFAGAMQVSQQVLRRVFVNGQLNRLMDTGNYSAAANNTKLVDWPLMGELLHLVHRGGDWLGPRPGPSSLYQIIIIIFICSDKNT